MQTKTDGVACRARAKIDVVISSFHGNIQTKLPVACGGRKRRKSSVTSLGRSVIRDFARYLATRSAWAG